MAYAYLTCTHPTFCVVVLWLLCNGFLNRISVFLIRTSWSESLMRSSTCTVSTIMAPLTFMILSGWTAMRCYRTKQLFQVTETWWQHLKMETFVKTLALNSSGLNDFNVNQFYNCRNDCVQWDVAAANHKHRLRDSWIALDMQYKYIQLVIFHQMLTVRPRLGQVGFVVMEALISSWAFDRSWLCHV